MGNGYISTTIETSNMTRLTIILPLAVVLLGACAPKVSETTRIQGRIEGGTADKLTVTVQDHGIKNQPVEIIDGTFCYELATEPAIDVVFTCQLDGKQLRRSVIPDGSDLALVFSPEGATLSSSNKKSVNYRMLEIEAVKQQAKDLSTQYMSAKRAGAPAEQLDSLAGLEGPLVKRLKDLYREDLEKQKDNNLSVRALSYLRMDLQDKQLDSLISTLDSAVIQTSQVKMIRDEVSHRLATQEGMPFVDFSIETEGVTVRLSDYVGQGRYVLADFWASWCRPCIVEMPYLKEAYKKYGDANLTILGIAASDAPADSRKAIRELSIPWPQMLGTKMVAMDAYGIAGIPYIILFGPDGTILRRDLRGEEIAQVLEEYLSAK